MWRGTGPNTDMFCGSVQDNVFKLRRNIYYRNDFLPAIKGRVRLLPNGSRVVVTMHMPFVTIVFLVGILVLMTKGALTRASAGYLSALVFFVTLALLGFIPEAVIAKRLITETVLGIKPGQSFSRLHYAASTQSCSVGRRDTALPFADHARSPDHPITRFFSRPSPIQNQPEADEPHC
jgi:hypothetical protein